MLSPKAALDVSHPKKENGALCSLEPSWAPPGALAQARLSVHPSRTPKCLAL